MGVRETHSRGLNEQPKPFCIDRPVRRFPRFKAGCKDKRLFPRDYRFLETTIGKPNPAFIAVAQRPRMFKRHGCVEVAPQEHLFSQRKGYRLVFHFSISGRNLDVEELTLVARHYDIKSRALY